MKIVIHIGYAKCASTTLQKHLFAQHSQISYLGLYPTKNVGLNYEGPKPSLALSSKKVQELHHLILDKNFKKNKEKNRKRIYEVLNSVEGGKVKILSNEFLTSPLFDKISPIVKAQRLFYYFPDAKILIVGREPFEWMISQYRDQPFDPVDITEGGYVDFDAWVEKIFSNRIDILKALQFEDIFSYYQKLYGKSNVLIVQLETLKNDPQLFSKKICDYLGVNKAEGFKYLQKEKENTGISDGLTKYRRVIRRVKQVLPKNNITVSTKETVDKIIKRIAPKTTRKVKYKQETKVKIQEYFRNTNDFLVRISV